MNIATLLPEVAARLKDKTAVIIGKGRDSSGKAVYESRTFGELDAACDRLAHGLASIGIKRGTRTLLMIRPGFDFLACAFAMFKVGAIPVMIDPGMGKINLMGCVRNAQPEAMIAIPLAHLASKIYPDAFKSVKIRVTAGWRWLWGGETLDALYEKGASHGVYKPADTLSSDMAAILFTTGSTGDPKGVVYDHGVFMAQVKIIQETYGITENDRDLPAFPLFGLFSVSMGMSVVIPEMDPTRPGKADPARIVEEINDNGVTFTFGSPAIWKNVTRHCLQNNVKLPSLKRVLMAGAPVPAHIHDALLNHILPSGARTHTPFGATESLPVCDIEGADVLRETAAVTAGGAGICVGHPIRGMKVKIMKIMETELAIWDDELELAPFEHGEIVVAGPVVTREYYNLPEHTAKSKMRHRQTGAIMHRMGDIGYRDMKGRIWFCGRMAHRVETPERTMFTIPCEAIFNQHPSVARSALVGLGFRPRQRPIIIIELDKTKSHPPKERLVAELLEMAAKNPVTCLIKHVLFYDEFPTDVRHNAKIFREKLRAWAESAHPHLYPVE